MRPFEEMSAWSVEEIESAVGASLRGAFRFQSGWDEEAGVWFTRFWKTDDKGVETVAYEDWGPDRRILAFNALGWLWEATRPPPSPGSPWVRRHENTRVWNPRATYRGAGAPDPADLDPQEIGSVYGGTGQPK